jgi:NAD(P)-dependent dehydrogenase (short-subunit alcohol dehydrogenase family)
MKRWRKPSKDKHVNTHPDEGMMTTIQRRDLRGLKALVTGATSGLGRAIAFQLARDGADVTVHGRDAARGAQMVEEIQLQGGRAHSLVSALAPAMVARGTGSIINISSMAGRLGLAGGAAYGATKAAVASLTQAWAAEYSPRGVRVNAVAPRPIYTRPEARELFDSLGPATAMKRAADPAEIAAVVAFLASPRASYMTGATVAVDGGRTAI